jgi:hypothetical protein
MKEANLEAFIKGLLERDSEKLEEITLTCNVWAAVGIALTMELVALILLEGCLYFCFCRNKE